MEPTLARSTVAVALAASTMLGGCGAGPSVTPAGTLPPPTASGTPSQDTPSAAAPSSPAVTTTPSAAPAAWRWMPVPDQDALHGLRFDDVAWTGARFVAIGLVPDGDSFFVDSPDGRAWHRQPALGSDARPTRLAARPGGVVAVGTIGDWPAAWTSSDGLVWTELTEAFAVADAGSDAVAVTDVAATDRGWVAVGREDPPCQVACGLAPVRALAWTSIDGKEWTLLAGEQFTGAGMNAIVRGDDGFVAAGVAASEDGHAFVAIWTSPDGAGWSRVADDAIFHPHPMDDPWAAASATGVAARPGMFVVVGTANGVGPGGAPAARAWWSTDGEAWELAGVADPTPGGVDAVAALSLAFIAVGMRWEEACPTGVRRSTDGRAWTCLRPGSSPEGFRPYAAAASATVEVAVGAMSAGSDGEQPGGGERVPPAIWWRSIP